MNEVSTRLRKPSLTSSQLGTFSLTSMATPILAGITVFILTFSNTVALRLLLLALLLVVALTHYVRERPPIPNFMWLFFALAAFALISATWSVDPTMTFKEAKNEFVYTFIAFFVFYVLASQSRVRIAGIAGFALAAMTMVGLVLGEYLATKRWVFSGYQGGVGNYSTFVVAALPVLIYLALCVKNVVLRITLSVIGAALMMVGFWTLNRALWPALFIEAAVALVFFLQSVHARKFFVIALFGFVALGTVFFGSVQHRFGLENEVDLNEMVLDDPRMPLWSVAWEAFQERPWIGTGFGRGAFGKAYGDRPGSRTDHAHNLFVNRAVQLGLMGLTITVALFLALALALWRTFRFHPDKAISWLAAAGLIYLAGLLAKNMTDDFFIREVSLLFWAIMGLILGAARTNKWPATAGTESSLTMERN